MHVHGLLSTEQIHDAHMYVCIMYLFCACVCLTDVKCALAMVLNP